jgi:two-component system LytT family response regulator
LLKAYILDDEQHAHVVLKTLLLRHFSSEIEIVGAAQNANDALRDFPQINPDLLFLDIEMPNINGMEMITKVNKDDCSVIFVTAYENFAVDAFSERASGYLLKPVDKEKFIKTVSDVIRKIKLLQNAQTLSNEASKVIEDIALPQNGTFVMVNPKSILYLKADGSYTKIISETENFHISRNLKSTSEDFDNDLFVKVNRSFIVNKNHIKRYSKKNGGSIFLSNNLEISIGATYREITFKVLNSSIEE